MAEFCSILLWAGAAIWGVLLIVGLINACLIRDIARINAPEPREWPFVSFIVPARNEEAGIAASVSSFCTQDYPAFEVIVVNDRSTDRTGEILTGLAARYANLLVIDGSDPPDGWLGKPNALQTALYHARGDWLLMTDGDAVHAPGLLRRAVAYALAENAGIMVVRPRHITAGILEAALMSGVNFFFFVVMPIFLVRHSRIGLFSTGSPVFNLIRRDALEACDGFACLKQAVVDDLEIGFRVKRAGHGMAVAFAGEWIMHRMYAGARQTVQGFGKTTFPTIRRAWILLPVYLAVGFVISILPYLAFAAAIWTGRLNVPATVSLVTMHVIFAGIAWRYGEPWYITFLNPLRELGWMWTFVRSFILFRREGLVWRGRSYT